MKAFWVLCVPSILAAQTARNDSVSAPIRDIRYDVTFMKSNAQQRMVDVAMTFTTSGGGTAPVVLSLPAWTPGAYEISNFARWVTAFDATGDGKPLAWDKLDFEKWRIRPGGAKSVRVSFRYRADTLDNAMSWARPDFLLFNGTNLFLYPEGHPFDFAASVTVHTENDWRSVTGMAAGTTHGTYTAANYHDLVDMPFFVGRFDLDSVRIVDRWVRFASYPAGAIAAQQRAAVWQQLERVIPPETHVFGETPWQSYTVMEIVDSSFGGASGLEHQDSHVDILSPTYVGGEFQPSLYAHEIFHSWNVKRLRPADMWPYAYARPQPTPWLWVSEGITDYYADLAEVRGGVIDEKGFYNQTSEKLNEVAATAPVSLEDASLNAWIHPVDGTEYIYYAKGSIAGLLLDILIRDASDNAHSLDDVMRGLYQTRYKQGRGFTSQDWWASVSAAAGGMSFSEFSAKYIDGRSPFPLDSILPLAGLRAHAAMVPRLGVMTQMDSTGIVVAQVQEGSAAAAAGIRAGDYLLTVGDLAVQEQQFGARLRAKYGASVEGTPLPIKIRRVTETITLAGKLQFGPGEIVLEPDPAAKAKAVRIRNSILKGS